MAKCNFCGRSFPNSQAVRAHLKACAAYRDRKPREFLPSEAPSEFPELSMADMLNQELEAEEVRLRLRGVQARHSELDARERALTDRTRAEEAAAEAARLRRIAERRRVQVEHERAESVQRTRRVAIQQAKDAAMHELGGLVNVGMSDEAKANALRAIEGDLSGLPVEELPPSEIEQIARAARERAYEAARSKARKIEGRKARRDTLIQAGLRSAREILSEEVDDWFDRWKLEIQVKSLLEARLTGEESESEVLDLVEGALPEEWSENSD